MRKCAAQLFYDGGTWSARGKITLDGLKQSHLALRLLRREYPKWKHVQARCSQYLNNLIEQDHCAIKRTRSISELWVAKTNMGSSALVVPCHRLNLKWAGSLPDSFRDTNF
jgi:transposase-like protein